jgi:hypothetical protein
MNVLRISRKLIVVAICLCRFARLTGSGYRAGVVRRHRRPGAVCLSAVVAAVLAAVGVPGVWQRAALASASSDLNWTRQFPATSPPTRTQAAMAYDAATGNVVLLGVSRDTWIWGP